MNTGFYVIMYIVCLWLGAYAHDTDLANQAKDTGIIKFWSAPDLDVNSGRVEQE